MAFQRLTQVKSEQNSIFSFQVIDLVDLTDWNQTTTETELYTAFLKNPILVGSFYRVQYLVFIEKQVARYS